MGVPLSEYKKGDWNAECDRCGFKYKASQLRREWQGFMVCGSCWEPRHPQDLINPRTERAIPKWTRPEPPDLYIVVGAADPDSLGRIPPLQNIFLDTHDANWKDDGDNVWKDD